MKVIAYKGMNSDMMCKGFQYEVGKTYKEEKAELCKSRFHACLNPRDVYRYYNGYNSRYFKVLLSGNITKCYTNDTNVAATEITILEEVTNKFYEICKSVEWWKNEGVLDLLPYQEGFARIQRGDGLYNFINKDGKLLSDEWFEWVDYFKEGFVRVQRNEDNLWNLIDKTGKILSDEWFGWCDNFSKGSAVVRRSIGDYYKIDKTGKLWK